MNPKKLLVLAGAGVIVYLLYKKIIAVGVQNAPAFLPSAAVDDITNAINARVNVQ